MPGTWFSHEAGLLHGIEVPFRLLDTQPERSAPKARRRRIAVAFITFMGRTRADEGGFCKCGGVTTPVR
jgi:hypothetical protein